MRGRRGYVTAAELDTIFQSTPPHEGATGPWWREVELTVVFQSTPPHEGATPNVGDVTKVS